MAMLLAAALALPALSESTEVEVIIGPSNRKSKTVTAVRGLVCPEVVTKDNWLTPYERPDQFRIDVDGDQVTAHRTDRRSRWGLDLKFNCVLENPAFEVDCDHLEVDDNCVRTKTYGNDHMCRITAKKEMTLDVKHFDVEEHWSCDYDWLEVGGNKYCGDTEPHQFHVAEGEDMIWRTDYSITENGWEICANEAEYIRVDDTFVLWKRCPHSTTDVCVSTDYDLCVLEAKAACNTSSDCVGVTVYKEDTLPPQTDRLKRPFHLYTDQRCNGEQENDDHHWDFYQKMGAPMSNMNLPLTTRDGYNFKFSVLTRIKADYEAGRNRGEYHGDWVLTPHNGMFHFYGRVGERFGDNHKRVEFFISTEDGVGAWGRGGSTVVTAQKLTPGEWYTLTVEKTVDRVCIQVDNNEPNCAERTVPASQFKVAPMTHPQRINTHDQIGVMETVLYRDLGGALEGFAMIGDGFCRAFNGANPYDWEDRCVDSLEECGAWCVEQGAECKGISFGNTPYDYLGCAAEGRIRCLTGGHATEEVGNSHPWTTGVTCYAKDESAGWKLLVRQTMPYTWTPGQLSLNSNDPTADNYAIADRVTDFKLDGRYKFKLVWPEDVEGTTYEWYQTSNPFTETVQGYEAVHVPYTGQHWGGLEPSTYALVDGSVGHGHWFYAVGSYSAWRGAYPAFAKADDDEWYEQPQVELYVQAVDQRRLEVETLEMKAPEPAVAP